MTTATATRRERLERLVTEMRDFADECDAKDGGASGEDITKLNKMGQDVKALADEVKAEAEAHGTLDMAKAFLGDLAGDAGKPAEPTGLDMRDGIVNPQGMTLGEAFVKSPAYEDFLKAFKGSDGNIRSNVTAQSEAFDVAGFGAKAPITGASSTSAGAFVTNQRLNVVSDLIGERRLTVQDLCTNIQISSDTFEYVTVTAKTNNAAAVAEATSTDDPTITFDDPDYITTPATGAGNKPVSDMTFAVVSEPVETIAHLIPITRRAAADAPQVRQMVDAFLLYGLAEEKEDQILNGNGTSPNLSGILDRSISTVGSAGTDLDAIVDAIRTIRGNNREPNALVVHPNDWFSTGFLLAKDTAGNYLVGDPRASLDQLNSLWGLRVVVTPAMTENTALVGDFRQAVVADRQQSAIYVTDSHKDWFQRNLLAVLAEERVGFGVLDVQAFCSVTAV